MCSKAWLAASVWLRLVSLPPPASNVRRLRRLCDILAAVSGLIAHASVTETVEFCHLDLFFLQPLLMYGRRCARAHPRSSLVQTLRKAAPRMTCCLKISSYMTPTVAWPSKPVTVARCTTSCSDASLSTARGYGTLVLKACCCYCICCVSWCICMSV
jgi:hypothetical protein